MEKKQGFIEKGKSELFFRKGKTGAWKNELSVDISKKMQCGPCYKVGVWSGVLQCSNECGAWFWKCKVA